MMNYNLDQSSSEFRTQLHQVADVVANMYTDIENQPVYQDPNPSMTRAIFNENMPEGSMPFRDILESFEKDIIPNSTIHYSPHFYPWVTSCASQASLLGGFLATALNVNATTWMNSAAASEIERQTIQWIGQFSGYNENASGVFLSGGSTANLTGLQIARRLNATVDIAIKGLGDLSRFIVYASEETHFCIDKSVDILGIGKDQLRKIPALVDFTMNIEELENQIQKDMSKGYIPMCIVANAGTVNTGAIDPLNEIAEICEKYNIWFHVDAAYGGCAANLVSTRALYKGLDRADSVAIDLHKWLFVPFEAGCILVKDKNHLKETFSVIPEYQKFNYKQDFQIDFSEYSFQQSRSFKAFKVWVNFKVYGQENLKKAINGSITVMQHLSKVVDMSSDFELISQGLSIVCFRYVGNQDIVNINYLNELNLQLVALTEKDNRIFIRETKLNDMVVIRCCCTNFRRETKHVENLVDVLRELGSTIANDITL